MIYFLIALVLYFTFFTPFAVKIHNRWTENDRYYDLPLIAPIVVALFASLFWPLALLICLPWAFYERKQSKKGKK